MNETQKTPRNVGGTPYFTVGPTIGPMRRRAGALMMGTALTAIVGLGYGRGAYAQTTLSGTNTTTQTLTGPGEFVTEEGFSVDTSGESGDGITIRTAVDETGDTTFTDTFQGGITGAASGIDARNQGDGALAVTTSGPIVANNGNGIYARNGEWLGDFYTDGYCGTSSGSKTCSPVDPENFPQYDPAGTDLTITSTGPVTGSEVGIFAYNNGSGALTITANGDVTGDTAIRAQQYDRYGFVRPNENFDFSLNESTGTDLSITAVGDLTGTDGPAVSAVNYGTGSLTVDVTGDVVSTESGAVAARNQYGGDMRISLLGDVESASRAIDALNGSYYTRDGYVGSLDIYVAGNLHSRYNDAIRGRLRYDGDLEITVTGDVVADNQGIEAEHRATGNMVINIGGNVTANPESGGSEGVDSEHRGNGDMTIIVGGDITSGSEGILAAHKGDGDMSITTYGMIQTSNHEGLDVDHTQGNGSINISINGDVIAADDGIEVDHGGTGDITISSGTVTGGTDGIDVVHEGTGALSITANGAVTGGTGDGIYASNASSEDTTITINAGGSVSTSGTDVDDWAIEATAPNGAIIVNNFGTVTGRVNLSNSNTFTNSGTWDLANTTSDFNATGNSLVVNEGLIIAASDSATEEWPWLDNLDVFRNEVGGTIRLADGATGDVFRIGNSQPPATADFVANGGTVELDVVLGGDGSATDRLDISGDVILDSAPTALAFSPVGGGAGGATDTGIEVVTVGGSSDAGAFVLAAPVEVGALAYDLSLGDCTDQADQNWYLCNNGTVGTTGAVFEAMPGVILNTFGRTDTLQQRLGARITGMPTTVSSRGTGDALVNQSVGPWVRTWGDFTDITPDQSSAGVSWQSDSWGFEAGIGTMLGNSAGGDLIAGVTLRYGSTFAQLDSLNGTGSIEANGFGIGASLTWFGTNGFYVDANGAIDFVSIDATSQGGGTLLDGHDDEVYSASIEIGQRIALAGGTTIVPQAQLSWSRMGSGQLTDELGNLVSFGDRETLTSRIGMTVEWDLSETELGAGQIYGFGNVLHDLSGSRTVSVAGTDVTQSGAGDWVELGGGFSLQPTETTNFFGQISYREAFDGVSGDAIALSAGLRMQW